MKITIRCDKCKVKLGIYEGAPYDTSAELIADIKTVTFTRTHDKQTVTSNLKVPPRIDLRIYTLCERCSKGLKA